MIYRQPGTYTGNFTYAHQKWGHVGLCPTADGLYFAKVICNGATLSACNAGIIAPDTSNWLVQGFTACVGSAAPAKYVALVNNYAKNCGGGLGITDYTAVVVGLIDYGSGAASVELCFWNFNL